jgi:hypothetical protein
MLTNDAFTQTSNRVYEDSSLLYSDKEDIETTTIDQVITTPEEIDNYYIKSLDSSLILNNLTISKDSVETLKRKRELAYAKYLDSLLLNLNQKQELKLNSSIKKVSALERFFSSPITKWVFWIIAGLFVAFLIYKLFFTQGFLQRSIKRKKVLEIHQVDETLPEETAFEKLIREAISVGDYRLGIRYHFLQILAQLNEAGAIKYTPDKTNAHYARELSKKTYRTQFNRMTLLYEYVWYGAFDIDANLYQKLKPEFAPINLNN